MTGRPTPPRGAPRMWRGVALAITSAMLAVAAHAAAGGGLPDPGLTALLTIGVAAVGVALADRRRSAGAIIAVLGAAQLATHTVLSFAETGLTGNVHMIVHGYTLPMLGAHAVAVLLTAWLLSRADDAIFLVAAALGRLWPRLFALPAIPDRPRRSRPAAAGPDRAPTVLL